MSIERELHRREAEDVLWLFALCPLIAVSDTLINAIGASSAVLLTAGIGALCVRLARRALTVEAKLAGVLVVFAGVVACIELLLSAYFYDLHAALGVFTPLILANLVLIGGLAAHEEELTIGGTLRIALTILVLMLILGAARELVGRGSLMHDAGLLVGGWARALETKVFRVDMGFLLGMLPPGAFIALGLLLALRNWWTRRT